jgi:hypothetical protein
MDRAFTFLPSSTLAARSRRHLPQARAWTVHLHSYHLRLWLLAAGVTYLKHAHGPCIYILTIFDSGCSQPASSTSSTRMDRAFTFLPSSTLAARSRCHLPQARAWACIYLLPGRVSMAAVTLASLSRDSTNQGHHHRRGSSNLEGSDTTFLHGHAAELAIASTGMVRGTVRRDANDYDQPGGMGPSVLSISGGHRPLGLNVISSLSLYLLYKPDRFSVVYLLAGLSL